MATRYLYLVRHGNYNIYSEVDDDLGGPLTALGEQQAVYTGQYLSRQPIDRIYTSTLRRAAQTTEVMTKLMPTVPVMEKRNLWEVLPVIPFRLEGDFAERFPGMSPERIAAQRASADAAFDEFFQYIGDPDSQDEVHEVLVCHGNLIRYLVCRTLNADTRAWANMMIHQGSVTRVALDDNDGMLLMTFNEITHMPPEIWVD